MMNEANTAVLVIDDEEMVRDNIEDILIPRKQSSESLDVSNAASLLFDGPSPILAPRISNIPAFTVDKASNGMEGVKRIREALAAGTPYAVIFLDMRMPGWSGLETAIEIRKYDSKAEIIFITAYSDKSIDEIVEQAGQNVGYHCKPYASEEIIQLATKAVTDYNKLRNLEVLMESISSIGLNRPQLTSLLKNILDQLASSVDTDMALIGKLHDDMSYEKILSIGAMEEKINLDELIARVKDIKIAKDEVVQIDELVMARLDHYSVFAVLKKQERLKVEKMYLLKLFVQNAAQAIRNAELNERLLQKEKLSAVGNAVGMVMHDLRSPIKNIKLITSLMRDDGQSSDLLDMIDQSAEQASEIFDDFLDFINQTPVKKYPVSVQKIVDEAIAQTESHEGIQNIAIHKNVPEKMVALGDESKLRRAICNIVNNAVDVLNDFKTRGAYIDITAKQDGAHHVLITITDNGPGVPAEIMKTLFEPFVTKQKSSGTGLGLAIVKQFVVAHGGEISVENNPGAVFTIKLPA
ncbi:hybrid sensor histidine kinase/response regulator [Mucilaginibacter sp. HMF5004]|uniref:hybrid sensor histidine kinase/response regulator n=1 Tax=Mucilaginibacter rivuli TaxID=2857527 RepID=UPI001C5EC0A2|nr:hybrid sensor histidine kinase/response regulator [Mucilaginibacter rivuli]MBW4891798.1 hybrid sensor histidine kinase/response regulator [Mucilaginibacter rivuli]